MTAGDFASLTLPEADADVCVIGSGPAGAIVAASLAAKGVRVLLLEGGGATNGPPASEGLGEIDVGGVADVAFARAFQLGGSSNLWAGRLAPLSPEDFAPRPGEPLSGWPIPYSELEPFYRQAIGLLGAPELPSSMDLPGFDRLIEEPGIAPRPFVWAQSPFRARDWLRERAREWPALSVVVEARCMSFRQDSVGRVIAARVRRPDGSESDVIARAFVLASGGLEVVRTLFNSTDRCQAGLGNDHGVLGRYFSTHPKADIAILRFARKLVPHGPVLTDGRLEGGRCRVGIGLDAKAQYQTGSLNHYVQLAPMAEYRASRAFEIIKGRAAQASPVLRRQPAVHGLLSGAGLWAFDMIGRAARLQRGAKLAVVRGYFDQFPSPDNRITRSCALDSTGMPLVDIHWRFTDRDRASVLAFLARLGRAVEDSGLGRLDISALKSSDDWELTALHSHLMGATRMGEDPRTSVTV